jgi:hypothetical protein
MVSVLSEVEASVYRRGHADNEIAMRTRQPIGSESRDSGKTTKWPQISLMQPHETRAAVFSARARIVGGSRMCQTMDFEEDDGRHRR